MLCTILELPGLVLDSAIDDVVRVMVVNYYASGPHYEFTSLSRSEVREVIAALTIWLRDTE